MTLQVTWKLEKTAQRQPSKGEKLTCWMTDFLVAGRRFSGVGLGERRGEISPLMQFGSVLLMLSRMKV